VKGTSVNELFFVVNLQSFFEKKNIVLKNSLKVSTVAYNIKKYLKFPSFTFWVLPNLAKYTYG
jgi:hypothetical protein